MFEILATPILTIALIDRTHQAARRWAITRIWSSEPSVAYPIANQRDPGVLGTVNRSTFRFRGRRPAKRGCEKLVTTNQWLDGFAPGYPLLQDFGQGTPPYLHGVTWEPHAYRLQS